MIRNLLKVAATVCRCRKPASEVDKIVPLKEGERPNSHTTDHKRDDPLKSAKKVIPKSEIQKRDERTRYLWKKLRQHTFSMVRQASVLNR